MTLTLLPPNLSPSLLPHSLDHLLFPLFSGCSKCLETAVGAGTGPGGWPHQGTVGHGSCQTRRQTLRAHCVLDVFPVRVDRCLSSQMCVCQSGLLQILSAAGWPHRQLPPQPPTHIQNFRSTFFLHRKATVGVYIYMHYTPVSAPYFA